MSKKDTVEEYQGSTIQHGPYNDRIYLMRLAEQSPADFPQQLVQLAEQKGYSKIFAKVPEYAAAVFFQAGFAQEAEIPGFFSGRTGALFMGYYLNNARQQEDDVAGLENILHIAQDKQKTVVPPPDAGFCLRSCQQDDVPAMAAIYRQTFASYPFPIHDAGYLLETMQSHVAYFGAESKGELTALSSAEMDREAANVEMTDFATLPEQAGHNLSFHLLQRMERAMQEENIRTAYTIARAASPAMNITFARAGYKFAGRLKNNTNISGKIESMNVWYKPLVQPSETIITH
ncbi:MAG: putative beta-lysine N-acetyltransferase [Candidatus Electrothrix aestuarii]|uniref:Beta-lysine N-acetyltransferase n=1 Tax=Candidatus Electrothrix aestuarii TaxID=3062594 RepID=A0AAU8LT26_9BACT|nr:putative beta-lysine N-acetyltransferase [Candidatus Electrothrix aestuarii]